MLVLIDLGHGKQLQRLAERGCDSLVESKLKVFMDVCGPFPFLQENGKWAKIWLLTVAWSFWYSVPTQESTQSLRITAKRHSYYPQEIGEVSGVLGQELWPEASVCSIRSHDGPRALLLRGLWLVWVADAAIVVICRLWALPLKYSGWVLPKSCSAFLDIFKLFGAGLCFGSIRKNAQM